MRPTIYCDMDHVLCDFHKAWSPLHDKGINFYEAVMDYFVYRDLDWMENGPTLVFLLEALEKAGWTIKLLTSTATYKPDQYLECQKQKQRWCDDVGIKWEIVFTNCGEEKGKHAHKYAILIDDLKGNCDMFNREGGTAILYDDAEAADAFRQLLDVQEKLSKTYANLHFPK